MGLKSFSAVDRPHDAAIFMERALIVVALLALAALASFGVYLFAAGAFSLSKPEPKMPVAVGAAPFESDVALRALHHPCESEIVQAGGGKPIARCVGKGRQ